jgi:hypothetical protein
MQEFIISEKTLNKIVKILEDKPFKQVIDLLNEIKAVPYNQNEVAQKIEAVPENEMNDSYSNKEVENANNNR